MAKYLFIAEKPSVAQEFAKVLKVRGSAGNGYLESENYIVTWCVGHLVTMSYPEAYDPKYKKWSLDTLPFIPEEFRYEVIGNVKKQFNIVSGLLKRDDVERIYVCTDSGREGEYIYRLVDQMAGIGNKDKRRVWIDSQTEEEINRGIREAKPLSEYDNLASSAYLRAKEDYLMGINFSRLLTLKYGRSMSAFLHTKYSVVSVGRVMTCVLGMVVRREREIRDFVKTPFYRVIAELKLPGSESTISAEWKAVPGSAAYGKSILYKDNGFKNKEDAAKLIEYLKKADPQTAEVIKNEKKTEKKNAPLLFNLAELQNYCSRTLKIDPDQTLKIAQELYEKKLTTYPRTDARVLSSAVAKEIGRNISGLQGLPQYAKYAQEILSGDAYKKIGRSRYTNDSQITDHYAIIPTGQGLSAVGKLGPSSAKVYDAIVRRFLSIFYPPAEYRKLSIEFRIRTESFFANVRNLVKPGYLEVAGIPKNDPGQNESITGPEEAAALEKLRKGSTLGVKGYSIKDGETSPPKRYSSGSLILAMENAGQLIEDEELRAQIKGSGIGTSATRAEILKKLVTIKYLNLNSKTQIITPALMGEMVYDVVDASLRSLLNPELTASWEKGLSYVSEGKVSSEEYMQKLDDYIRKRTYAVSALNNQQAMFSKYEAAAKNYSRSQPQGKKTRSKKAEGQAAE
ncbi:MAG: type IA DNA topoisomerase [Lachnospiraceae bacterium]|nr:type IA DNA topoisomerase [Lachnospiraceae bacterium]